MLLLPAPPSVPLLPPPFVPSDHLKEYLSEVETEILFFESLLLEDLEEDKEYDL